MKAKAAYFPFLAVIFIFQTFTVLPVDAVTKIMPLGNSITQGFSSGESDLTRQVAYRKVLFDRLTAAGYDVDFVGSRNNGSAIFGNVDLADHEGHPGWSDYEIVNGAPGDPDPNNRLVTWLNDHQPSIVLLHIGTNDLDPDPNGADDVEAILDEIDVYSLDVWVILARIIAREDDICSGSPPTTNTDTTTFNNNVEAMAQARINDKIVFVDMECGAGIDYSNQLLGGDMWDTLHPYTSGTGYAKMADVWFDDGLSLILPVANAGTDQTVDEGNTVTLDGSGSVDPKGGNLSYKWVQLVGTPVLLSDDQAEKPTFSAPDVGSSGDTLIFELTVTDEGVLDSTDTTGIEVHNPASGGGSGGGGGGCFISTAAYGAPMMPNPIVLREFSDRFMVTNFVVKGFVDFYYTYSPPADFIAKHDTLKAMVRLCLWPLVGICWVALQLGIGPIVGFLVLLLIMIVAIPFPLLRKGGL
jgi:hypothetical protein